MAEDYTPTTETVREVYAVWRYDEGVLGERDAAAEFDAWLAAHDRQVAERVLRDAAEFERRGRTHLAAAVRAHSAAPALPREERDVIRALLDEGQRYEMGSLTERFWLRDVVDRVPALLDALDAADAVLAAVADHDGLADVLAAHVQHEEQAIVDGHVWCASCDTQIGDWTRERGIEALDAMWTAHLADVVRAWMAQP